MKMKNTVFIMSFSFLSLLQTLTYTQNMQNPLLFSSETLIPYNDSSFKINAGWSLDQEKLALTSPENDLTIYLIQLPFTQNFEDLADQAWKNINPNFNLKILSSNKNIAQNGWEESYSIQYDIPSHESRLVYAGIRVFQSVAYIYLLDGAASCYSRRGAQIALTTKSWRPNNLKPEDLSNKSAKKFTPVEAEKLSSFIENCMQQLDIPGLAIAIVQNNSIVFSQGFGVTKKGSSTPVTSQSVFLIGSITKPLTSLMMAKMVDLKQLSWDSSIISILPIFHATDQNFRENLLLHHTVSASTGMPRNDLHPIVNPALSAEEAIKQTAMMVPTTGFGETFQYSNQLVALGGFAAANAYKDSGTLFDKYEAAMQELIFHPLNMHNTFVYRNEQFMQNITNPHACDFNGENIPLRIYENDFVNLYAPSASIWSTVEDLAQYIQLELNNGINAQGKRIISEEQILKRRTPGIKIIDDCYYGFGLYIQKEQGLTLIGHGGSMLGFASDLFFLPEQNLGVIILTNASPIQNGIKEKIIELLFDAKEKSDEIVSHAVQAKEKSVTIAHDCISTQPADTEWIKEFLGSYYNKDLGIFTINQSNQNFELNMNNQMLSLLGSQQQIDGSLVITIITPPLMGLEFQVQKDPIKKLICDCEQIKYEFTKIE